jgi:ABC-type transporter Mla MlaB component
MDGLYLDGLQAAAESDDGNRCAAMAASPPRTVTLRIRGPLERADLPGLFARTCALLDAGDVDAIECNVADLEAGMIAAEALARLALVARRRGCRTRLSGASPALLALVAFVGLAEVLPRRPGQGGAQRG